MKYMVITLLLAASTGCHSGVSSSYSAEPFSTSEVNVGDGVDREEAQKLAWRYFGEFHGACGAVTFTREMPTAWVFATAVGYAALPGTDIPVYKDGSKITQAVSPDVVYSAGKWSYRGKNFLGEAQKG